MPVSDSLTDARWGLGYQRPTRPLPGVPDIWGPQEESFGHCGFGGQFGYADPVNRVSVAFVRSHLTFMNTLGQALVDALYVCLAKADGGTAVDTSAGGLAR